MRTSTPALILAAIAALTLSGEALAAPSEPSEQGAAFAAQGDFLSAAGQFRTAYVATNGAKDLWNLALAEIKADRPAHALMHLRLYVARQDASPEHLPDARRFLERLPHEVGVLIVGAPAGADILIDGEIVGTAPLSKPVEVEPNIRHTVGAQAGSKLVQVDVAPTGAERCEVDVPLPEAGVFFDQGTGAMEKKDYAAAADAFRSAYELTRSAPSLWNLALAELKIDHPAEALEHLRSYLKRTDASSQNVERAKQLVSQTRAVVGSLIIAAPAGAHVTVDGLLVGKAPLAGPVEVDPNAWHTVEAGAPGTPPEVLHSWTGTDVAPPGATSVAVRLAFAPNP
jgi:tetratricopeptide (TPR) repeat protein